jgi:hypothetical protein
VTILNLVSGPRNISTALMYSFAQRTDTKVMDEPYYALYLTKSGADHPGREDVLHAQSANENVVTNEIMSLKDVPVVFIKNMAHHMEVMEDPLIKGATHIFLIRDPRQIIASYAQVIERPVMRDIGIEYQYGLFEKLKKTGATPVVIDSGLLLENPSSVLKQLCHSCSIGFQSEMLQWKAGPKEYDGVWATHWYKNVHRTTGFQLQTTSSRTLPAHLNHLYQQAKGYYEKLLPFSLKA